MRSVTVSSGPVAIERHLRHAQNTYGFSPSLETHRLTFLTGRSCDSTYMSAPKLHYCRLATQPSRTWPPPLLQIPDGRVVLIRHRRRLAIYLVLHREGEVRVHNFYRHGRLLYYLHSIPGVDGYNGTVRTCETNNQILELESYGANLGAEQQLLYISISGQRSFVA